MRRNVKTYEAWGKPDKDQQMKEKENRLSKMKKDWNDFEDLHPWDFQFFYDKISAYDADYQHKYRNNDSLEYEISMESNDRNDQYYYDIEWRKRNGHIMVTTETGGYSGGNCWNDNDPEPYDTGNRVEHSNLSNFIEHILYAIFGKNHAFANIPELMVKFNNLGYPSVKEGENTNCEYYGNSTDFQWYEISLWDLYQFLAKEGAF